MWNVDDLQVGHRLLGIGRPKVVDGVLRVGDAGTVIQEVLQSDRQNAIVRVIGVHCEHIIYVINKN